MGAGASADADAALRRRRQFQMLDDCTIKRPRADFPGRFELVTRRDGAFGWFCLKVQAIEKGKLGLENRYFNYPIQKGFSDQSAESDSDDDSSSSSSEDDDDNSRKTGYATNDPPAHTLLQTQQSNAVETTPSAQQLRSRTNGRPLDEMHNAWGFSTESSKVSTQQQQPQEKQLSPNHLVNISQAADAYDTDLPETLVIRQVELWSAFVAFREVAKMEGHLALDKSTAAHEAFDRDPTLWAHMVDHWLDHRKHQAQSYDAAVTLFVNKAQTFLSRHQDEHEAQELLKMIDDIHLFEKSIVTRQND